MKKNRWIAFILVVSLFICTMAGCSNATPTPPNINGVIESNTVNMDNFSTEIEDARGDKFTLTTADLYYRFYLNVCRSGILSQSWKNANEIEPQYLINFFTSQTNWNHTTYEDIYLPSQFLEGYIKCYFDVDAEQMRKSMYYNLSDDVYQLPMYPAESIIGITNVSTNKNLLTIHYEMYDWNDSGDQSIAAEGKLTIEIEAFPGYYKYVSNELNIHKN